MESNQLTKITSGNFYNTDADFYQNQNSNEIYMTIEQLANCLEYDSRRGIDMMLAKHKYLRDSEFIIHQNLWSMDSGRNYETTLISEDGIYEITMLSTKPKAKEFRAFVRKLLKGLRKGELTLQQSHELQSFQLQITQQLQLQQSKLDRLESLIWTLIPKRPNNIWKTKMTPIINTLAEKYSTTFNAITHQIYDTMQFEYDIPLNEYQQDWLIQNPLANRAPMYEVVSNHPELHELFESLIEIYDRDNDWSILPVII